MDGELPEPLHKILDTSLPQENNERSGNRSSVIRVQDLFNTVTATPIKTEPAPNVNGCLTSLPSTVLPSNSFLSFKDTHGIERKVKIIRVEKGGTTPSPRVICTPVSIPLEPRISSSTSAITQVISKSNEPLTTTFEAKCNAVTDEEGEQVCNSPEINNQLARLEEKDVGLKLLSMLGAEHESLYEGTEDSPIVQSATGSQKCTEMEIQPPPVECEVSFDGAKERAHSDLHEKRRIRKILTGKEKISTRSGKALTFRRVGQERQVEPCHLCGSLLFSGASVTKLDLQEPLPFSSLHPPILLAALGMSCPLPRDTCVGLCKGCNDLLVEADISYKKLQVVIERMREAWPGYILESSPPDLFQPSDTTIGANDSESPKTPECISIARKYVPILPKSEKRIGDSLRVSKFVKNKPRKVSIKKVKPCNEDRLCICGFCGMDFYGEQDWSLHVSAVHHVQPRWLQPSLQATLKVQINKELERPDPAPHLEQWDKQNVRKCSACGKHFLQRLDLVQHLREHHNMVIDDDFLTSITQSEVDEPPPPEPPSDSTEPVHIKAEVQWHHDLEDQDWEPKEVSWQQEESSQESKHNSEECEGGDDGETNFSDEDRKGSTSPKGSSEVMAADDKAFSTSPKLPRDSRGSSRAARWWCRACGEPFPTLGKLHRHKQQNHPGMLRLASRTPKREFAKEPSAGGPERPPASRPPEEDQNLTAVNCLVCGLSVEGHENLKKHMEAAHEGCVVILERDGCGGVIDHRLSLTAESDGEGEGEVEGEERQEAESHIVKQGKKLSCRACGAAFNNLATLAQHQHEHHKELVDESGGAVGSVGIMMVECELCGRRIHGLPALRLHMTKSHNRPYSTGRPHRCKLCLFQARTRSQLEQHMRLKHGVNVVTQVKCKLCGKSLSASYLDRHIANMHENKKRFACEFCGMKFNDRGTLKSHIYFEHANKNWKCEPCQLSFSKYHRLRQHNYYVHSTTVYSCNLCGKGFKRKCDHTEHIKRKHTERVPIHCPRCPNTYLDRKKLRTHLMRKHDVPWEDTISRRFARLQQESNCLRIRAEGAVDHHHHHHHPNPASPSSPSPSSVYPPSSKKKRVAAPEARQQVVVHQEDEGERGRRREGGGGGGTMEVMEATLGEDGGYNIVEVTEAPGDMHAMGDISYIILQTGEHLQNTQGCHVTS